MINYDNFEHGYKGIMDVQLTDLYPIDSIEVQCLSYVDKMLTAEYRKFTERIVIASNVDNLPESILDYLAIQYRIPYYDSTFDIEKKRALVTEGYQWSMTAGTTDCIQHLINAIFGNGKVIEWYEDGTMQEGEFDIEINEKDITEDIVKDFARILKKAKNAHSKLRNVVNSHNMEHIVYVLNQLFVHDDIILS